MYMDSEKESQKSSLLVEEKVFSIKKDVCADLNMIAAIDRGSSLTKILFATEKNSTHVNLHFALFKNSNFKEGLIHMKENAILLNKSGKMHVTGVGCVVYKDIIKEVFNLDIEFIDELISQFCGSKWLLDNFTDDELCYDPPHFDLTKFSCLEKTESYKKLVESFEYRGNSNDLSKYPVLCVFVGSGGLAFLIKEDGSAEIVSGITMAGKSFLGFAKLLLGTNDYDEVMELASKGNRANVDLQVKEIIGDDPASPYGRFPPEMPLMTAGKPTDQNRPLSDFKREDLAHSLVAGFCGNIFTHTMAARKSCNMRNIYFGGNFFRHELTRIELSQTAMLFGGGAFSNIHFLKTGHTGAVGAMICSPEFVANFFATKFG